MAGGCDAADGYLADLQDVVVRNIDWVAVPALVSNGLSVVSADTYRHLKLIGDDVEPLEMVPVVVGDEDRLDIGLPRRGDQLVRLIGRVYDYALVRRLAGDEVGVVVKA